ncbi:hypothetical protein GQ44DRAFT_771054 [Phaeosphaeriaceae sp. PMI808]|nr:hypothetical protein GQ44DRAFT_771054 [Phaeosphaeriaceae sp. PMI808]
MPTPKPPYTEEEEQLLIRLKNLGLDWYEITSTYNQDVPPERRRTEDGLKNKYERMVKPKNSEWMGFAIL